MKKGQSFISNVLFSRQFLDVWTGFAFKVLANKGSNEVKSGDGWLAVKTGNQPQDGR